MFWVPSIKMWHLMGPRKCVFIIMHLLCGTASSTKIQLAIIMLAFKFRKPRRFSIYPEQLGQDVSWAINMCSKMNLWVFFCCLTFLDSFYNMYFGSFNIARCSKPCDNHINMNINKKPYDIILIPKKRIHIFKWLKNKIFVTGSTRYLSLSRMRHGGIAPCFSIYNKKVYFSWTRKYEGSLSASCWAQL